MANTDRFRIALVVFAAIVLVTLFVMIEQRTRSVPPAPVAAVVPDAGTADAQAPSALESDPVVQEALARAEAARKAAGGQPPARRADTNPAPAPVAAPAPNTPRVRAAAAPAPAAPTTTTRGAVRTPRNSLYLPGQTTAWNPYEIAVTAPLLLRAGGQVAVGPDSAGPDGLTNPGAPGAATALALPSAPYLSLIGRLCSRALCSDPFLVGSRTIVCPSTLGVPGGTLQLRLNQRTASGRETFPSYVGGTGGFSVYAEAAPPASCGENTAPSTFSSQDRAALDAGQTLDWPEFSVASSQNAWKPFFLPLDRPLRLRASGEMRPKLRLDATGPDGIAVPASARWAYPGSDEIVVDAGHPLFAPGLPYQALIGRLCGEAGCGPAFLVGTERVVCADAAHRERLELWVNGILERPGMLDRAIPLSLSALERQQRTGRYRFTVSPAPQSACAN